VPVIALICSRYTRASALGRRAMPFESSKDAREDWNRRQHLGPNAGHQFLVADRFSCAFP
jgi:hypothetical protein